MLEQCISHRTENDISAFVVGFGDAIEHVVDHINIIPAAAGQSILACTTIQMIVTYITRQAIVPCSADSRIVTITACESIMAIAAIEAIDADTAIEHLLTRFSTHCVISFVPHPSIVA